MDVTDAEVEELLTAEQEATKSMMVRPRGGPLAAAWPDGKRMMVAKTEILPSGETRLAEDWRPPNREEEQFLHANKVTYLQGGPVEPETVVVEEKKSKTPMVLGGIAVAAVGVGLAWAYLASGDDPDPDDDDGTEDE